MNDMARTVVTLMPALLQDRFLEWRAGANISRRHLRSLQDLDLIQLDVYGSPITTHLGSAVLEHLKVTVK